ncbi:flagellar type III secretion system pore protein FliP [Vibrio barjaei]|uniref:flagellar type III secretion system pore protein FliP n=1 Tax=Vibrio barjaei TaxID=1676683 RepID=UPI0022835DAD|nr:flagellar type III secretion system pore protein FliP [Vibrio barjaei]MCY9872323.1 flagellar type III secretion system pore protein FliP [Vibrio barjaei]
MINRLITFFLLSVISFNGLANSEVALFTMTSNDGPSEFSTKLEILILMTLIGFVPTLVLACTCFTRIIIVLSLLRQAIGLQQSPPNQVLVGIAIILSTLIMKPVLDEMHIKAYTPYKEGQIDVLTALETGSEPLKRYMIEQTEIATFENVKSIAREDENLEMKDASMTIIVGAYLLSELKAAFQIGFMIFLPFIAIDLIVASVLMSMGMMMLSPLIVSLPFKLLIFVVLDGWNLLTSALASSFWVSS